MVNTLFLPAEDNALVVETNADGWARCFLVPATGIGRERTYLGADAFSIVVTRLQESLRKRDMLDTSVAGEIDGLPVTWLLSLAEAHHCLYANHADGRTLLFWENAHETPVTIAGVMRLSLQQRTRWQEVLAEALAPARTPALAAR